MRARMALVCLHGPLRNLAGGRDQQEVAGATVHELLRGLEDLHPPVAGWILDERGAIRRHINVFINGERGGEETSVAAGDRVEILPAITGGV
jgi:sulfur-carrier protein